VQAPDLLVQTLWEGLVSGVLYALIALGFVLIFKASGVFNFAQGIMVVFAALTLVGLHEKGVPALVALVLAVGVMLVLAIAVERVVLRPLVNQPDIILFMATFGLTYFLIGLGELIFGGSPKQMIASELYLPTGATERVGAFAGPLPDHELDDAFDELAAGSSFAVTGGGRRIGLTLDAGYPCAQVFSPPDKDLVCFEPMTAPGDALRTGGFPAAAPGRPYEAVFTITVDSA